jgi:hypothetical protein
MSAATDAGIHAETLRGHVWDALRAVTQYDATPDHVHGDLDAIVDTAIVAVIERIVEDMRVLEEAS